MIGLRPKTARATARATATALLLAALGLAGPAQAQLMGEPPDPRPDPEMFSSGLYAEAEAGALMFLGDARRPLGTGVAVGVRLGYEIGRWLAIQGHALSATHETDFDSGPQSDQLLQVLQATGELKLSIPLGQWSVFGYGGGGIARLSTNLLGTAGLTDLDVRISPMFGGGGGADYHTRSRHFSFGVNAAFWKLPQLYTTGAMTGTLYIRYTF
jgi:Outer membrane protein beta-barrel domain